MIDETKIREYLETLRDAGLSVPQIAKEIGVNKSCLHAMFRNQNNRTVPREVVIRIAEKACPDLPNLIEIYLHNETQLRTEAANSLR